MKNRLLFQKPLFKLLLIFFIASSYVNCQTMMKGMAIASCYADINNLLAPVAAVYDIRQNQNAPLGQNWVPPIYNVPNWSISNLGQIFGIAIDSDFDVYLAASDIYNFQNNTLGTSVGPGGSAGIYKSNHLNLNNVTTLVTTLNSPTVILPSNSLPNTSGFGNGIGNIAYDKKNNQLFASNLEDGRIYRINLNSGQVLSSYDPFIMDNGAAGMPISDERIYGIGVFNSNSQTEIFFARTKSVTTTPGTINIHEIFSVPLMPNGEFSGTQSLGTYIGNETLKISLLSNSVNNNVVTDLAFSNSNRILIAERGNPHGAATIEFELNGATWNYLRNYLTGSFPGLNTAGGVDYGYKATQVNEFTFCDSIAWSTMNYYIKAPNYYYGLQGMNASAGNFNNQGVNDIVIDLDGIYTTQDKFQIGDIEIAKEPCNLVQNYSLSCDDHINVSLDSSCCAIITPEMILEGNYPVKCLKVVLRDKNGIILPSSPKVTGAQIGQLITVELIDTCTKNRCWGTLTVEDKLPPRVMCQNPDTVFCNNTSYQWSPPIVRDNCTGIATVHIITDNTIKKTCDSFCIAERQIQYYYTDFYGNHSDTCIKKICYKKLDWKDIKWPSDTLFSCEFWTSPPSPTHAGIPTGGGKPLYPSWGECKLAVTYEDQIITICPKSFKVLRKWTVIDWCKTSPNNVAIHYQVIKVVDEKGPVILCSPDITISTDVWTCTGTAIIPPPKVIKECSDSVSIEVSYKISSPNGPTKIGTSLNNIKLLPNGYYSVTGLPHGLNWVSFVVTDGCGNSSECFTEVTVIDQVPPVAVCDQKTVVTLTIDGTAKIEAYTFDDGSHDNCMLDRFEVKRMDNGVPCSTPNGDQWGPYVFFCCKDIGKTIMVSLQVWDKSGNSNTCMVEVVVQDKIAPVIFCPPNITVSCAFDYSDVKVFGNVVTDISLRKPIVINDPGLKANGPLQDGYAYDGCGARVNELAPRFNLKCGSGTITRNFEAIDSVGLRSYCTQTITIQDIDPANVTVQWPRDFTSNTVCANVLDLNPNVTGLPRVIGADACNQIVTTHTDQLFELEPDACIKILRKWIILDWCIYDPNASNPRGYWTWVQTIKVTNTVGPVFTSSCADRTIETFGPGCGGRIELRGLAKDDCTDSSRLVWYHSVDINNDGVSPGIEYLFSGPGNDASNIYPLGKHKITYLVKDACGNESKCSFIITVVDKKKPTPYCVTSITTTVMPSSKEIEIWAKDFNLNSEDNCTPKDRLQYFFKVNNTYQTSMKLTCANIGQNTIKVYVVDEYGNEDYCEVTLVLQDPNKVCGTTNLASDGHIRSTTGILMPEVSVKLVEAGQIINESKTNNQGVYAFQNLIKNHSYTIKPTHNENPSNGVSTQDILMIQKHILGVKQFDTPFQYIAADVNKTSAITAADISEIRKLILGVIPQFSKNDSWRFVSKSHVFKDLHSVFPFEEKIEIESINEDKNNLDFIGVKIGDVNASASIIGETNLATRQKEKHKLSYQFLQDRTIAIIAGQELNMTGIQLGIELNSCQIESISSAALEIEEEHYLIDGGRLKIAYTTDRAKIVQKGDILFYFRLKEDRKNVSLYSIRQEEFKSEFYDQELKEHALILDDEENKNTFLISSVEKDGQQIKLKVHSENHQEVNLRIYNVQGILLAQLKRTLADGLQEIQIPCSDFNTGVFLVQCENTNQSQIIKLINY